MINNYRSSLKPNSLSPDVFTGSRWPDFINFWLEHGVDPNDITCIPSKENTLSSSVPTAVGVIATTVALSNRLLSGTFASKRFLMEGHGGVGSNALHLLIDEHKVPAGNITVIDPNEEACLKAELTGVNAVCMDANKYYHLHLNSTNRFDIWLNNGVGDTVGMQEVIYLLNAGVKIFVGGANNLFLVADLEILLDLIARNKAFAFPDFACSGGGWTMAVLEQIRKATGKLSVNSLDVIRDRNVKMVHDALEGFIAGGNLWQTVAAQAEVKIQKALQQHYKLTDADFEIKNWVL